MRNLSGQDLFPVISLVSKLGIKDIIKNYYKAVGPVEGQTAEDLGAEFTGTAIETAFSNIERCKGDINRLLASLCGVTVAEIEALDLEAYGALLMKAATKPELGNFIGSILPFIAK